MSGMITDSGMQKIITDSDYNYGKQESNQREKVE